MTRFTAGAIGTCGVLAGIEMAHATGAEVPHAVVVLAASVAAVITATVAARNLVFVRRGPVILSFRRDDAMLCDAREASTVRSAAQLRGTMGGAGYLHPRRLVFSAAAWAAVSVQSLALVGPQRTPATFIPLGVAIGATALAVLFPASPFFYREAGGDCVVAFPPRVCRRLLDAAGAAPALAPIALGMSGIEAIGGAAPKAAAGADGADAEDAPRSDSTT